MSVEHLLVSAVDAARAALIDVDDAVGEHLRAETDADGLVSHYFEAIQPGYVGWTWVVSVSAVAADAAVTINDVVLLPGSEAIVAPAWTPYRDRIRPGDLAPGDVLPPDDDDLRLVPAWLEGDAALPGDADDARAAREIAAGREWVLSVEGRSMAADRWYAGPHGPHTPIAQQASGSCRSCGFLVPLAGDLADRFGVCANGMANDDGHAVALDHGCGAHSGVRLGRAARPQPLPPPVFDTVTNDDVEAL